MIGFDKKDLLDLFYSKVTSSTFEELSAREVVLSDLQDDKVLMKEVADKVVAKGIKHKEDIEIFVALDFALTFCPDNAQIYFVIKSGVQSKSIIINSIDDFKSVVEEKTIIDFGIYFNGEFRQFQLKQYRGELTTENILESIVKNIKSYGDNIGEVNLLVSLQGDAQSKSFQVSDINFGQINKGLLANGYTFTGQVLIAYNEQNKKHIINQVYPKLTTSQREIATNLNNWL